MKASEFAVIDRQLRHAIQTGVAYEIEKGSQASTPKHLRTGLDAFAAELSGMARLLISKGVITEEEYFDALAQALREEVKRYEIRLSERYGASIRLG
jgi:hypothetical protein